MSISHSLSNALTGMSAASRLAEVVSSNIANALTDGYGRRTLDLNAAAVGGRGAGVEIGDVTRIVDRGILGDRRLADADLAGFNSLASTYARLEDMIGSPDSAQSISGRIAALEQALVDASTDPSSDIRLGALNDRLVDLTAALNEASDGVQALRAEADADIATQVDTLNTALQQVERLNADITFSYNTGNDPSALMDQRQRVIDQIAEIVPVRELDRPGGQVALMTPAGEMLIDGPAKQFDFTANTVVTADMTLGSGALSGLTRDGTSLGANGIGKLSGGSLGAAFEARDTLLPETQLGLDNLAADLIQRFSGNAVDPTLTPTEPGLFTDDGAAYDPLTLDGLAGRISLNAAVDPAQGGALWRLRDGINAATPGATGDASLLLSIADTMADPRALSSGGPLRSISGHAADIESTIGSGRLDIDAELSFATARWDGLKSAEAAGGVDTDHEMQMLLRIEQAYAANARLVQTVESMLDRLMEL